MFQIGQKVKVIKSSSSAWTGQEVKIEKIILFGCYVSHPSLGWRAFQSNKLEAISNELEHMVSFKKLATEPTAQPVTFHEAFRMDMQAKKARYEGQSAIWKKEGRCPECGELGRYHLSAAVCSQHGTY